MMLGRCSGPGACGQVVPASRRDVLGAMATALSGGEGEVSSNSTHCPARPPCCLHAPPLEQWPGKQQPHLPECLPTIAPAKKIFSVAASMPAASPCLPSLSLLTSSIRITVAFHLPTGGLGPSLLMFLSSPMWVSRDLERSQRQPRSSRN